MQLVFPKHLQVHCFKQLFSLRRPQNKAQLVRKNDYCSSSNVTTNGKKQETQVTLARTFSVLYVLTQVGNEFSCVLLYPPTSMKTRTCLWKNFGPMPWTSVLGKSCARLYSNRSQRATLEKSITHSRLLCPLFQHCGTFRTTVAHDNVFFFFCRCRSMEYG